jgi:hypothetical protein
MATRTWNGANDSFFNAGDWLEGVVPVAGDSAVINSGTVNVTGAISPIFINMDGANGPTLALANATLPTGTHLNGNDEAGFNNITARGNVINAGGLTFSGLSGGEVDILLFNGSGGSATSFVNTGGISVVGQRAIVLNQDTNTANQIVNNGTISFRGGASGTNLETVVTTISGTGTIRLQPNVNLQLGGAVSGGQQVIFEPGAGSSTLFVGDATEFNGIISGFGSSDQVRVIVIGYHASTYSLANGIGTFTFTNAQGNNVGHVSFAGNHPQSDFTLTPNGNVVTITTPVANEPARIAFSDTVTDVSGKEPGTVYTGPVAGLQYQYLWNSTDAVALKANVNNVFLKGNSSGDALKVTGGSNVLDGGPGSNFLIGADGTDGGNDTFYVDGRGGQVTWSTIVGFHRGDLATIFGFVAGQSDFTDISGNYEGTPTSNPVHPVYHDNEGTGGFTGATMHSELSGQGTGINASITFAGIDSATAANFATSMGVLPGGTPYMLIAYV